MNEFVVVLSIAFVIVGAIIGAWFLLGPVAFTILAIILGFFGLMSMCASFWSPS